MSADSEVTISETLDDAPIVQSVTEDKQAPSGYSILAGRDDDDVDDSREHQPVSIQLPMH